MYSIFLLCVPLVVAYYPYHEDQRLMQNAYLKSLFEDLETQAEKQWNHKTGGDDIYLEDELRETPDEYDEEVPDDIDFSDLRHGSPSIRAPEFLSHSSLASKQVANRVASENQAQQDYASNVKPETTLPAYCNPPNPCPVGYTEKDGCIEVFENTAAFSRAYQAAQDCMCDTEHMFDCPAGGPGGPKRGVEKPVDSALRRIMVEIKQIPEAHKSLVAKKFFEKRGNIASMNEIAAQEGTEAEIKTENPYLLGEKLPVAAKKGFHT